MKLHPRSKMAGFYVGFFVWGASQFEWPKARSILGAGGGLNFSVCNLVH